MKRLQLIILLFIIILLGCKGLDTELFIPKLEFETESVVFTEQRGSRNVVIQTNVEDWSATVAEAGASWCSALPQGGASNPFLQIFVNENSGFDDRETTITLTADKLQKTIAVIQIGLKPTIRTDRELYNILFQTDKLTMNVVANVNYEVIVSEEATWLTQIETDEENTALFSVETNQGTEAREAEVTFKQTNGMLAHTVRVVQTSRPDGYEGDSNHDFGRDVQVRVSRAESSEPGWSGYVLERSFDDDMATFYHTAWNVNEGPVTAFPVTVTYFFDNASRIDYLVFRPRQSPSTFNGSIKDVEILVSTVANPGYHSIGDFDFGDGSAPVEVAVELEKPLAIRFIVKSVNFSDPAYISSNMRPHLVIPEMQFFRTEQGGDYGWLFADDVFSELRPEITEGEIWQIKNEFMKNYALSIYRNEYQREFRVQEYKAFAIPDEEATILKTAPFNLLDNPTGIIAEVGQEFLIIVGETYGQKISMRVVDLPRGGGWAEQTYILKPGVNSFKITGNGGMIYIMYHTSNYRNVPPIKINIPFGTINGYFDIAKHTIEDWRRIIDAAKDDHFDLLGNYAHMKFTTSHLRQNTGNGVRLIEVYDSIVSLQAEHLGLVKYGRQRGNRCLFTVGYGNLFMNAMAYRTNYTVDVMDMMTTLNRIRSIEVWGPAHEAGHCNQTRPGFTWTGIVEVSTNVSTLHVQTTFNKRTTSGLLSNDCYQGGYNLFFPSRQSYALVTGYPGEKLPVFWQLELYFSWLLGYTDFYPDLYEHIRTNPDVTDIGQLHMNFVRICSDLTKTDLSEFFGFWGFLQPGSGTVSEYGTANVTLTQSMVNNVTSHIRQYELPKHKIQYIRCDNVELFRTNAAIVQGTVIKTGNRVTLNNWQNVVAIEQVDMNGNLIIPHITMWFDIDANMNKAFAISATGDRVEIIF